MGLCHDAESYHKVEGKVKMKFAYHRVILSNAKDLIASTLCIQIFRFAQQLVFTTFRMTRHFDSDSAL